MKKFLALILLGVTAFADTPPIIYQFAPPLVKTNNKNISIPQANSTTDGYLSASDWTHFNNGGGSAPVWGNITGTLSSQTDLQSALNAKQNALTLGNLTDAGTDGITVTGGTGSVVGSGTSLSQHVADASHNGYLASSDWSIFNGKQPAGNYVTALTGDVSASGPGAVNALLASTPNRVYVNFLLGSDSTGTGTFLRPWKTLQFAYNSINPSVNGPFIIFTTGGNNDTDTYPITGKTNVSIISDYGQQVHGITLPDDAQNDGATFVNMTFLEPLTWVSNSIWARSLGLYQVEFFSGPDFEQNGSGQSFVTTFNSLFTNSTWGLTAGGLMNFCDFYGSTTFKDMPTTYFGYLDLHGSYNIGAMSIAGAVDPVYFTGFIQDVPFGASMTFVTTANGTPAVEMDSAGLPPTYTGSPTITYLSQAKYENYTATTASDWNGTPPTNVGAALDRIAAALNALGHKP